MWKLALMFRTRNPERDQASDVARLKRLEGTVHQISDEVEREHRGLRARLVAVQDAIAFLYEDADANNRADRLTAMEKELLRAMARTRQLKSQIEHLDEIKHSVRQCFREADTSAPLAKVAVAGQR